MKSALKASVVCSGTEILQLSKTELTNAHSLSSTSTCRDVSSARDDPSAEDKEEDPSKDKALTPESRHSDIPNEEDAKVQDESPEAGSSSDVPLGENASMKVSEDATISSSSDVVHVMKLSSVLLSLKDHLTEVEQSWVELHTDIPAVQQLLHQVKEIRRISPLLFDVLMPLCLRTA